MARDAVAATALALNDDTNTGAGVTITPANGANITGAGKTGKVVVRVTNTAGAEYDVTFKAGENPPAFRKDIGDLVIPVAATTGDIMICLESARFLQDDGSINVDFETSMTGKVWAFLLPAGV